MAGKKFKLTGKQFFAALGEGNDSVVFIDIYRIGRRPCFDTFGEKISHLRRYFFGTDGSAFADIVVRSVEIIIFKGNPMAGIWRLQHIVAVFFVCRRQIVTGTQGDFSGLNDGVLACAGKILMALDTGSQTLQKFVFGGKAEEMGFGKIEVQVNTDDKQQNGG